VLERRLRWRHDGRLIGGLTGRTVGGKVALARIDHRRSVYRSLAGRDGWIVAASEEADGLDALASPGTNVLDDGDLTLLPAFFDVHEHLLDSARNLARVRLEDAHSIDELVALIRARAAETPEGQWIQTSNGWNESNLAERRLPTAAELDRASAVHPVLAPRGGHVCVTNSRGLQLFGVTAATPDPPGGTVGHLDDGTPSGVLEGGAAQAIKVLVPPPLAESVDNLADACGIYAALGVGSIREALVLPEGWEVYQSAWERGRLSIRCLPMLLVNSSDTREDRAPGTLVVEHAFLADDAQRTRAIRLGVAITVQHALLYTNGQEILASWGPERAARVMPVRSWLDEGAVEHPPAASPRGFRRLPQRSGHCGSRRPPCAQACSSPASVGTPRTTPRDGSQVGPERPASRRCRRRA
jgi:predicted amidohydrolase YtcJ